MRAGAAAESVSNDASGGAPPSPNRATTLPDDALFGIFSRASGAADVARAAAIARVLPLPPAATFLPHLALGVFFHQRKTAREGAQLRFVTSSRLLAGAFAGGGAAHLVDLDRARPVASRNGHVVLELRRAGGLTLCVWNPMTGAVSVLPPLSGDDSPGVDYACAILTSDDLVESLPGFYERRRRSFTALRSYSSDSGCWGPEARKPGDKISGGVLRQLGPAVVLRGVAYWPTHHAALGVRLDGTSSSFMDMDVCSVPYSLTHCELDEHVLGASPDGRLRFVGTSFVARRLLIVNFLTSQFQDNNSVDQSNDDERIQVPQIKLTKRSAVKLRWFGEKSGTLIFTVGETGSSTSDVFALNVATTSVEKLAGGVCNHACRNLFGYEMDRAALLASVARR